MANTKLYVTEYRELARDGNNGMIAAGLSPAATEQSKDIGAASVQFTAFSEGTRLIRVVADVDCCIKIGSDPTAEQAFHLLPAGVIEYYGVKPGDTIAVIQEAP